MFVIILCEVVITQVIYKCIVLYIYTYKKPRINEIIKLIFVFDDLMNTRKSKPLFPEERAIGRFKRFYVRFYVGIINLIIVPTSIKKNLIQLFIYSLLIFEYS